MNAASTETVQKTLRECRRALGARAVGQWAMERRESTESAVESSQAGRCTRGRVSQPCPSTSLAPFANAPVHIHTAQRPKQLIGCRASSARFGPPPLGIGKMQIIEAVLCCAKEEDKVILTGYYPADMSYTEYSHLRAPDALPSRIVTFCHPAPLSSAATVAQRTSLQRSGAEGTSSQHPLRFTSKQALPFPLHFTSPFCINIAPPFFLSVSRPDLRASPSIL